MKGRWILAGILGLACLAGIYMAVITWNEPDGGGWTFVAFAALFLVLTWATARPPKQEEAPSTHFAPSWFFDLSILFVAFLILLGIVSCIFRRG